MPSKAQCWVVSYARRRADGSRDGASKEGLLTIPKEANVMLLHTHPDGARLAHGAYTPGLSPGKRMSIGAYECELLMLSPHGGGGNPAYAAAFVRPGEVLPNMTPYKEEGWLEWLGLDDLHDDDVNRVPVVLRAPQLPSADDPQPTVPITFARTTFDVREDIYEQQRRERNMYEHERSTQSARMVDYHYQQHHPQYQQPQNQQPQYAQPAQTVGGALMSAASATVPERNPSVNVHRSPPSAAPRLRESVFDDEYIDDDEVAFAEDVRFDNVPEPAREVETATVRGTSDELDALRAKLAELERLTGTTVEEAERALESDLVKTHAIVPELLVVHAEKDAPSQEPAAEIPESAHESTPVPPMDVSASPVDVVVTAPHVSVIEVPPAVSVSANIFKTSESQSTNQMQGQAIETIANAEIQATPSAPAAHAPVVRASPQVVKPIPSAPQPSIVAVTPEEVDANDAWAAAVARRNRSVDEEDSDSSDVEDDTPSRAPAKVVRVVSSTNEKNAPATLNSVSTRAVMFENGSTSSESRSIPSAPVQVKTPEADDVQYVAGSVAARASLFGEQTSLHRRRD